VAPPAPPTRRSACPLRAGQRQQLGHVRSGRPLRTTSSIGLMPTGATATKSVAYGRRSRCGLSAGAIVVEPFDPSMMTLPSGGALATEAAASLAVGAGAISTTTVRFKRSPTPGAISRARRSFGPPAGSRRRDAGGDREIDGLRAGRCQRQGCKSSDSGTAC